MLACKNHYRHFIVYILIKFSSTHTFEMKLSELTMLLKFDRSPRVKIIKAENMQGWFLFFVSGKNTTCEQRNHIPALRTAATASSGFLA